MEGGSIEKIRGRRLMRWAQIDGFRGMWHKVAHLFVWKGVAAM